MAEKELLGKVKLRNVRLSFAHLYEPQPGKVDEETGNVGEPKHNCAFLIPKNAAACAPHQDWAVQRENIAAAKKAAEEVKSAKWGKTPPKLKPEKVFLRDGDLEDYDGYEGMLYISASNSRKPVLKDRVKDSKTGKWADSPVGQLYSGCYVNATVHIWAQDNKHGKRLNASLELVQFVRHGDAFGAKQVDADEEFTEEDLGEAGDGGEALDEDADSLI